MTAKREARIVAECEASGDALRRDLGLPEPVFAGDPIRAAVLAERERCAKIAAEAEAAYDTALAEVAKSEQWQWALNEMSDDVNEKFFGAVRKLCQIAARISSGE